MDPVTKSKDTAHPRTGHEGPEGKQRYSSTLSLTSAIDGMGGQPHAPAALSPGKTPYPFVYVYTHTHTHTHTHV